jgi:hypothetical protein
MNLLKQPNTGHFLTSESIHNLRKYAIIIIIIIKIIVKQKRLVEDVEEIM